MKDIKKIISLICIFIVLILFISVTIYKVKNSNSSSLDNSNINENNNLTEEQLKSPDTITPAIKDDVIILDAEGPTINPENNENTKLEEDKKVNTSDKISQIHYFIENGKENKNIIISNIKLSSSFNNNLSTIEAKITNNSETDIENQIIFIEFYDKNNESIGLTQTIISIKSGSEKIINVESIYDFSVAKDVKIYF